MLRAEVGTTCPDDDTFNDARATTFATEEARASVSTVAVLEVTFFSLNVSVIGHRVSAQINTFSQSLFN